MKITFMGAGSTVFARNVIGDCMCVESLRDSVFALYDIDGQRLEESRPRMSLTCFWSWLRLILSDLVAMMIGS